MIPTRLVFVGALLKFTHHINALSLSIYIVASLSTFTDNLPLISIFKCFRDYMPILSVLMYNKWFDGLTVRNMKLVSLQAYLIEVSNPLTHPHISGANPPPGCIHRGRRWPDFLRHNFASFILLKSHIYLFICFNFVTPLYFFDAPSDDSYKFIYGCSTPPHELKLSVYFQTNDVFDVILKVVKCSTNLKSLILDGVGLKG